MEIILHSDDINLLDYWIKTFQSKCSMIDDIELLKKVSKSLIVINYSAFCGKEKEIIPLLSNQENLLLVLHRIPDIDTARTILSYGARGYGNALMKEHFILSAVATLEEGMVWLHPEFTSQLITQIQGKEDNDTTAILQKLSHREEEVALCLKEGDTYKVVAEKLVITPRTVKAHAHSIYAKLHVKDRLALALLLK